MDEDRQWLADRFEEQRGHLRAVAYRMLGSLTEADDAVQDAWLRLSQSRADEVENLSAWLTTVVGRVCLNVLRSRNVRREEPLGVHVPDPVISPETHVPRFSLGLSRGFSRWPSFFGQGVQEHVCGLVAELLHLGEQVPQLAAVLGPLGVEGGLGWGQAPGHCLVADLAGVLPVGPVPLTGVGVAGAACGAADGADLQYGAGRGEADLGDRGGQLAAPGAQRRRAGGLGGAGQMILLGCGVSCCACRSPAVDLLSAISRLLSRRCPWTRRTPRRQGSRWPPAG